MFYTQLGADRLAAIGHCVVHSGAAFCQPADSGLSAGHVIVAHPGNGASLCGLVNGRSVDTTMGFTALDGLMMGTRCGALDPGVILYLLQQPGLPPEAVQTLLYEQSGLLGVSGISGDMRSARQSQPRREGGCRTLRLSHLP